MRDPTSTTPPASRASEPLDTQNYVYRQDEPDGPWVPIARCVGSNVFPLNPPKTARNPKATSSKAGKARLEPGRDPIADHFAAYAAECKANDNEPEADRAANKQRSGAERFLQKLRPGGPWVLTAIVPDGDTVTITAHNADEVAAFIREHDGKRNLYYSVNPTRTALNKKAAKTDMAAIEFALADLDPDKAESSDAAKARYLAQLNGGSFKPYPVAAVDSGNGLQCLWRLKDRIELGKPVRVKVNGKSKLKFAAADQAAIDDVEERIKAIMLRLGAKPGTQNIDRILRLPGTTNLPNRAKRELGRIPCMTKSLWFNNGACPLDAFPKPENDTASKKAKANGKQHDDRSADDPLEQLIHDDSVPKGKRSERVWRLICEMLRRGYQPKAILRVLLDRDNAISAHIYDQAKPEAYAERQIAQAIEKIDFIRDKEGIRILPIADNIRLAMIKLGVGVRYDRFGDRVMLDGLEDFGPALEDAAVNRLWLSFGQRFRFHPALEFTRIVVNDAAQLNGFHPVRDYLARLQWDGKPRVDRWLVAYAGAEDSEYTRAVGALTLIAAVRRIRQPGCKFDEMLVLEQPLQGTDKSSALAALAVHEDWFADDLPLNVDSKRVIETLRGRWIIEAAELSGMKKADVEHLKAMLSRRIDRARMAYGRLPIEAPRQCVLIGTTNKSEYLRDTTGNRRFWPVRVQPFDLAALRRDRDQLWAEAAVREANGESIRLRRELWPLAAREQQQRLADDPFVAILNAYLGDLEGKIRAVDVWIILDLRGAQLNQESQMRTAEAMKRIGWKRPNRAGILRFGGKPESAYVRGNAHWKINVMRDPSGLSVYSEEALQPSAKKT